MYKGSELFFGYIGYVGYRGCDLGKRGVTEEGPKIGSVTPPVDLRKRVTGSVTSD